MNFNWLRNFLKGCSLTAALFVFQACYGTPQGLYFAERDFNFEVMDSDGHPVYKAKILMKPNSTFAKWTDSVETSDKGFATLVCRQPENVNTSLFRIEAEGYVSVDTLCNSALLESEVITVTLKKLL